MPDHPRFAVHLVSDAGCTVVVHRHARSPRVAETAAVRSAERAVRQGGSFARLAGTRLYGRRFYVVCTLPA